MEPLLLAQTREAFNEAFPALLYDNVVKMNHDESKPGVLIKISNRTTGRSWLGLVIRESDIPILIEKAKERVDGSPR